MNSTYRFSDGPVSGTMVLNISREMLDLDKTLDCGQCFRWNKAGKVWTGIAKGEVVRMRQENNGILIDKGIEHKEFIEDYFDLRTDYGPLIKSGMLNGFEQSIVDNSLGLRILKQEQFETFISFIISQRKSIKSIKRSVEQISTKVGKETRYGYLFPSATDIAGMSYRDLMDCGLGYRVEYVREAAERYHKERKEFSGMQRVEVGEQELIDFLKKSRGVGDKVANCVALFGYHKLNAFPVDVWIQRIIDKYYGNKGVDTSRFGGLAGVMQQFMFYSLKGKV